MTTTGYLAAAYLVLLALLLIYFAIMAARLTRVSRDVAELEKALAQREQQEAPR